jgi:hypothetical protein
VEITIEELEEIDRNARAYGYEIGKGKRLVRVMEDISQDNPFLDPDWRVKMEEE